MPRQIDYGLAFSLVVNREREHAIEAALKQWCPVCQRPSVSLVPARLRLSGVSELTGAERRRLQRALSVEIEAKLQFDPDPLAHARGGT